MVNHADRIYSIIHLLIYKIQTRHVLLVVRASEVYNIQKPICPILNHSKIQLHTLVHLISSSPSCLSILCRFCFLRASLFYIHAPPNFKTHAHSSQQHHPSFLFQAVHSHTSRPYSSTWPYPFYICALASFSS